MENMESDPKPSATPQKVDPLVDYKISFRHYNTIISRPDKYLVTENGETVLNEQGKDWIRNPKNTLDKLTFSEPWLRRNKIQVENGKAILPIELLGKDMTPDMIMAFHHNNHANIELWNKMKTYKEKHPKPHAKTTHSTAMDGVLKSVGNALVAHGQQLLHMDGVQSGHAQHKGKHTHTRHS